MSLFVQCWDPWQDLAECLQPGSVYLCYNSARPYVLQLKMLSNACGHMLQSFLEKLVFPAGPSLCSCKHPLFDLRTNLPPQDVQLKAHCAVMP
eukprot:1160284-Pelagomonas_calceolata.AAC.2